MPFLEQLPQTLINGLTLGSLYALIALGYSMVYGVLKLLNFAHGDVYMIGAYIGFYVLTSAIPENGEVTISHVVVFALMILLAMLGTGVLGIVIERFAYRPLRNAPRLAPLISALGVSFLLQNLVQLLVSPRPLSYGNGVLIAEDANVVVGNLSFHSSRLLLIATTIVLMLALTYFVRRTRLGRAMRAVSIDLDAAAMMGVNVDRVIVATFFIGSALAGAGGVLNGIVFFSVRHTMGFQAGLKGFTASVLGGIGNIPGAVLGGVLLGLAEAFVTVYISATYKDVIAFILLIIVLLVKPSGLLGRVVPQKV